MEFLLNLPARRQLQYKQKLHDVYFQELMTDEPPSSKQSQETSALFICALTTLHVANAWDPPLIFRFGKGLLLCGEVHQY